jgi:hypothetical protein
MVRETLKFDLHQKLLVLKHQPLFCRLKLAVYLKHCTMVSSASKYGGKWPKLHVLYKHIVGNEYNILVGNEYNMNALHNAIEDTRLCAEVYLMTV